MKINITINDLNYEQASKLIEMFGGMDKGEAVMTAKVAEPVALVAPAPIAPLAPLTPAEEEPSAEDVTGQVDAQGLPWDARIHSSNKKRKADGTWNKRRGVQEMEILRVEAELRANLKTHFANGGSVLAQPNPVMAAPVAPLQPVMQPMAPVAPVQPMVQPEAPVAPLQPMMPAPTPATPVDAQAAYAAFGVNPISPVTPVVPAVPAAPAMPLAGRDFNGVLARVQRGCATGRINNEFITNGIIGAINATFNTSLNTLVDVSARADLVEQVHQILDANQL